MSTAVEIPFHRAAIGQDEIDAVTAVLRSGWLTTGPKALEFEREFARYVGCQYAISVNSCTAALQLALDAIGLKPGDEVLLPTYTFAATGEVVTYFGARPVLCDSVCGGFNVDAADMERRITEKTRAVIAVHIAGDPCDLNAIHQIAQRRHLHVIEDAAHALPASYCGRRVGSISELTAFSFYATKTITTGEGGMLATDNELYATRARNMRLHGISGDAWKRYSKEGQWYYQIVAPGYKLNLTDLAASIGLVQLAKADSLWKRRSEIAKRYLEAFSDMEELEMPPVSADTIHAWHLFILRIRPEKLAITRKDFIGRLKAAGIGTSVHFIPLHLHPFYAATYSYQPGAFPNAEDSYSRCMSLPLFPGMTEAEVEYVVSRVRSTVQCHSQRAQLVAA
ncbi:MAG: DegT/DnrJ/EryC1/StrS family aminotransferase [Acidobacteriia bacterium]|nr:DegT/DnrJ/EryC1/StrS family aminotransferase [Terriglobia bacterium]